MSRLNELLGMSIKDLHDELYGGSPMDTSDLQAVATVMANTLISLAADQRAARSVRRTDHAKIQSLRAELDNLREEINEMRTFYGLI